jgi:non-specific serine/threonine protein kinase
MDQLSRDVQVEMQLPATLPTVYTSFIGRQQELTALQQLLVTSRLVTITGAAGCGKTRLALNAAQEIGPQFPDGVFWGELAQITDPDLVLQVVASALNVAQQAPRPLLDVLSEALENKQLLLVLDNCEHLLGACAALTQALMATTAIRVLATSREPLGVIGETRYPLQPMSVPSVDLPIAELRQYDAIRLFIERAHAIVPSFALTVSNAPAVISICRRLDGIPLAIELASARLNVLSVEQIDARLDARLRLLAPAAHITHTHHETLRAAIEWSHELLSEPERILLRRLSVFAGGCTLPAAEVVCANDGIEQAQILELLASLVNKSLVVAETITRREARYSLLEMINEFGREKLIECGELSAMHDQLLQYILRLTADNRPQMEETYQVGWLDSLESEIDNVRASLSWAVTQQHIEAGFCIANGVYPLWQVRGSFSEGIVWYERLLQHTTDAIPLATRVEAMTNASYLAMFLGDAPAATKWSEKAVALCEAAGDAGRPLLLMALSGMAGAERTAGRIDTLYTLNETIIALMYETGESSQLGTGLHAQGMTALLLGKYDIAQRYLDDSIRVTTQTGDQYLTAMNLIVKGDLARCQLRFEAAVRAYESSLMHLRELAATNDIPTAERGLAFAALRNGDHLRARALFSQSLTGQRARNHRAGILSTLLGIAAYAAAMGRFVESTRLYGYAAEQRAAIPTAPDSIDKADQLDSEHYLAKVRIRLGTTTFDRQRADARTLSLTQALDLAAIILNPETTKRSDDMASLLTTREREIVSLIGRGLSNGEIADALVLSKRTVEKHVANILSKLDFSNRAQIVRWAMTDYQRNT